MTASTDERVLFDVDHDKRIATITLNNPKQRNSYDAAMREAVARCLDVVAEDDDITVALLRGADGVFSTGADMNNAYGWYGERDDSGDGKKSRPSQRRRLTVDRKSFGFYHNLMGFPKVTVGEISGYALGGGFEMALMTDISVIARDTQIGMGSWFTCYPGRPDYFTHWGGAFKYAASVLGLPIGDYPHSRPPQAEFPAEGKAQIDAAYRGFGLVHA